MNDSFLSDIDTSKKKLIITFLLDKSSSMQAVAPATLEGINEFINSQRAIEDGVDVSFNLMSFSTSGSLTTEISNTNINEVGELLEYNPQGWSTALYDSMFSAITQTEKLLQEYKDASVLFVTMTDGVNNDGRTTKYTVFNRITNLEATGKWKFVYLGANQDAYAAGTSMGVSGGSTLTYTHDTSGVKFATASTSGYTSSLRQAVAGGTNLSSVTFNDASSGTTNNTNTVWINAEAENNGEEDN